MDSVENKRNRPCHVGYTLNCARLVHVCNGNRHEELDSAYTTLGLLLNGLPTEPLENVQGQASSVEKSMRRETVTMNCILLMKSRGCCVGFLIAAILVTSSWKLTPLDAAEADSASSRTGFHGL